ncbi:hypothetical protein ACQJBY_060692 [Aegilops geniculata]
MDRRRRPSFPTSAGPAPPLEDENLLLEILPRLPPLPSSLPRACLVCKRWRRLVSDPKFLRRFRAHHCKPPLLGFFVRGIDGPSFTPTLDTPDRVPAARFSLPQSRGESWAFVGCRHGLALLINHTRLEAVVWDPITGHRRCVAFPPGINTHPWVRSAALLCPSGTDHVHDDDLGSRPLKLVLVGVGRSAEPSAFACVYDSESGAWGNIISAGTAQHVTYAARASSVLVGNALHWLLIGDGILKFDFERQSLVVIERPLVVSCIRFQILRTHESRLGFAMWTEGGMEIWERKSSSDNGLRWALQQIIQLDKLLPLGPSRDRGFIAGFDEDTNVIFLSMYTGRSFMIQLESMQLRSISGTHHDHFYPYTNFFTAGRGIGNGNGGVKILYNT